MQKENTNSGEVQHQYVGPYRLEKTLGKGQTGKYIFLEQIWSLFYFVYVFIKANQLIHWNKYN